MEAGTCKIALQERVRATVRVRSGCTFRVVMKVTIRVAVRGARRALQWLRFSLSVFALGPVEENESSICTLSRRIWLSGTVDYYYSLADF